VVRATTKIACDAEDRLSTTAEKRALRFATNLDRLLARSFPLVLGISKSDCELLRDQCGVEHVRFLPLSIPDDGAPRNTPWMPDGRLRLLHLGRVSHLPSYRSLEFLFEQILPLVSADLLDRMVLNIVGRIDEDSRSRRIRSLATQYQNVNFLGYVDDVLPYYEQSDLQVVASTDATGLRTRTIESFAYGLPVLSTEIAARGIDGLTPGEDLLVATTPLEFARNLESVVNSKDLLARLSKNGRSFYLKGQSRKVVAKLLASYLDQFLYQK
jgi:glycosyltransferase involved in cell wall biosynthesis